MLVEMGSYTFLVKQIHGINLTLEVIEVIEGAEQPLVIEVEVEKRITIGRKQTNKISFPDDAHMSNTHACIFPIGNSLFIEDLEATNGYILFHLEPGFVCQHKGTTVIYTHYAMEISWRWVGGAPTQWGFRTCASLRSRQKPTAWSVRLPKRMLFFFHASTTFCVWTAANN